MVYLDVDVPTDHCNNIYLVLLRMDRLRCGTSGEDLRSMSLVA